MGAAYRNSSTGADFGNLYGLLQTHQQPNWWHHGGGHQAVWCDNGVPKAALGHDGVWGHTCMTALAVLENASTVPTIYERHWTIFVPLGYRAHLRYQLFQVVIWNAEDKLLI
ncbi:hypothetical protein [Vibrio penaeicida]|uniref:hypothetical protein n=1 Tax=Vibrio penaeicida TaxID=104609 RepID=UPI0021E15710|nr:hypothetical protein [Vibrio penaeicida]